MRFSAINAVAVLGAATLTAASPVAVPAPVLPKGWGAEPVTGGNARRDLAVRNTDTDLAIHKREIITAIVTAAGTAAITAIVDAAVKEAGTLISQIANFDNVRPPPFPPLFRLFRSPPPPGLHRAARCRGAGVEKSRG